MRDSWVAHCCNMGAEPALAGPVLLPHPKDPP